MSISEIKKSEVVCDNFASKNQIKNQSKNRVEAEFCHQDDDGRSERPIEISDNHAVQKDKPVSFLESAEFFVAQENGCHEWIGIHAQNRKSGQSPSFLRPFHQAEYLAKRPPKEVGQI